MYVHEDINMDDTYVINYKKTFTKASFNESKHYYKYIPSGTTGEKIISSIDGDLNTVELSVGVISAITDYLSKLNQDFNDIVIGLNAANNSNQTEDSAESEDPEETYKIMFKAAMNKENLGAAAASNTNFAEISNQINKINDEYKSAKLTQLSTVITGNFTADDLIDGRNNYM